MKAHHTPGPWKAHKQTIVQGREFWIGGADAGAGFAQEVADVYTHHSHGEANAHLIAAAPELLSALEELIICLQHHSGVTGLTLDAVLHAQAKISKAKGE